MPQSQHMIRDWSGGLNNRQDPRDIRDNESSFIQNMSIDSLGKIKTAGGLFANLADSDGDISSTPLTEYIVNRICSIVNSGGYGLFYFESDHSRDSEQTITETKSGTALVIGTAIGNINFSLVQTRVATEIPGNEAESTE
jgi:hypothetical protein